MSLSVRADPQAVVGAQLCAWRRFAELHTFAEALAVCARAGNDYWCCAI